MERRDRKLCSPLVFLLPLLLLASELCTPLVFLFALLLRRFLVLLAPSLHPLIKYICSRVRHVARGCRRSRGGRRPFKR